MIIAQKSKTNKVLFREELSLYDKKETAGKVRHGAGKDFVMLRQNYKKEDKKFKKGVDKGNMF